MWFSAYFSGFYKEGIKIKSIDGLNFPYFLYKLAESIKSADRRCWLFGHNPSGITLHPFILIPA
jgi:hypothetical protein